MNVEIKDRVWEYIKANFSLSEFLMMLYVSILMILIYDLLAWWLYMIVAVVIIGIAAVSKWREFQSLVFFWDSAVNEYIAKEAIEIDMYRIQSIYEEFKKHNND